MRPALHSSNILITVIVAISFSCQQKEENNCLEYGAKCQRFRQWILMVTESPVTKQANLKSLAVLESIIRDSINVYKADKCYTESSISFANDCLLSIISREGYLAGISDASKNNEPTTKTNKERNTKWVYFTAFVPKGSISDIEAYYSKVYKVSDYTDEKMLKIKDCLIETLKSSSSSPYKIVIQHHLFGSYSQASEKWEAESGTRIFGDGSCFSNPAIRYEDVFPNN
ncbi:hypothetical protein [Sediminibacterium soli]|uniref:hypothetical protein n=1 Tax=Sediminibacterium soli TaxID=2698829 RepID=UPI00137A8A16|nr:hypothetical protein [Sediminibacterium soli]NCI48092.1 hypothetical protein [Sediminibacterium soli]